MTAKKTSQKKKEEEQFALMFCAMIVLAAFFAEIMSYDEAKPHYDYSSIIIGFVGFFGIYFSSQQIIYDNSFLKYAIITLILFVLCAIKQSLMSFNLLPLLASGVPLLYVGYFRFLLFLFFKEYPKVNKKPVVVFGNKFGPAHFEGKVKGYKPTRREVIFSLLLFLGFMLSVFGAIILSKKILS